MELLIILILFFGLTIAFFAFGAAFMAPASVLGARLRALAGQRVEVLVDGTSRKDAGELSGRTRCNRVVNFDGRARVRMGDLVRVCVTEVLPHSLRGTLAPLPEDAACLSR